MLVCAAGMSTSLLVNKMKSVANSEMGGNLEIFALSESEAQGQMDSVDVVLLGPQVSYIYDSFKKIGDEYKIPVAIIDPIIYGRMDGKQVLNDALQMLADRGDE